MAHKAVEVAVRIRPFLENDVDRDIAVRRLPSSVLRHHPDDPDSNAAPVEVIFSEFDDPAVLHFDQAFDPDTNGSCEDVYENVVRGMVQEFLDNADPAANMRYQQATGHALPAKAHAVFMYGQTNSGKTFTWDGVIERVIQQTSTSLGLRGGGGGSDEDDGDDDQEEGHDEMDDFSPQVNPNKMKNSFKHKNSNSNSNKHNRAFLQLCAVELYNDHLYDIGRLEAVPISCPAGVNPLNSVTWCDVETEDDWLAIMENVHNNRSLQSTQMNTTSSRSHVLLLMRMVCVSNTRQRSQSQHQQQQQQQAGGGGVGNNLVVRSQLCFVDLAGCERVSRSHASGERLKEARYINASLASLGNVIHSLSAKGARHQQQLQQQQQGGGRSVSTFSQQSTGSVLGRGTLAATRVATAHVRRPSPLRSSGNSTPSGRSSRSSSVASHHGGQTGADQYRRSQSPGTFARSNFSSGAAGGGGCGGAVAGSTVAAAGAGGAGIHVPYRDGKLTWMLSDFFIAGSSGHGRLTVVVTVSPTMTDSSETLSALRFGARARGILVVQNSKMHSRFDGQHHGPTSLGRAAVMPTSRARSPQLASAKRAASSASTRNNSSNNNNGVVAAASSDHQQQGTNNGFRCQQTSDSFSGSTPVSKQQQAGWRRNAQPADQPVPRHQHQQQVAPTMMISKSPNNNSSSAKQQQQQYRSTSPAAAKATELAKANNERGGGGGAGGAPTSSSIMNDSEFDFVTEPLQKRIDELEQLLVFVNDDASATIRDLKEKQEKLEKDYLESKKECQTLKAEAVESDSRMTVLNARLHTLEMETKAFVTEIQEHRNRSDVTKDTIAEQLKAQEDLERKCRDLTREREEAVEVLGLFSSGKVTSLAPENIRGFFEWMLGELEAKQQQKASENGQQYDKIAALEKELEQTRLEYAAMLRKISAQEEEKAQHRSADMASSPVDFPRRDATISPRQFAGESVGTSPAYQQLFESTTGGGGGGGYHASAQMTSAERRRAAAAEQKQKQLAGSRQVSVSVDRHYDSRREEVSVASSSHHNNNNNNNNNRNVRESLLQDLEMLGNSKGAVPIHPQPQHNHVSARNQHQHHHPSAQPPMLANALNQGSAMLSLHNNNNNASIKPSSSQVPSRATSVANNNNQNQNHHHQEKSRAASVASNFGVTTSVTPTKSSTNPSLPAGMTPFAAAVAALPEVQAFREKQQMMMSQQQHETSSSSAASTPPPPPPPPASKMDNNNFFDVHREMEVGATTSSHQQQPSETSLQRLRRTLHGGHEQHQHHFFVANPEGNRHMDANSRKARKGLGSLSSNNPTMAMKENNSGNNNNNYATAACATTTSPQLSSVARSEASIGNCYSSMLSPLVANQPGRLALQQTSPLPGGQPSDAFWLQRPNGGGSGASPRSAML